MEGERHPSIIGENAMTLLGGYIPAIGPKLKTKSEALLTAKEYVKAIGDLVDCSGQLYRVMFSRQTDGMYMMLIKGSGATLNILHNLDELTIKRFQKSFSNNIFIITCFFEENENLECLALTDGMGAVLYVP